MHRSKVVLGAALIGLNLMSPARAQIHADVDLEAGASLHVLSSRPPGTTLFPEPGPSLVLSGHLAILPLLRAGIYVLHDFSPLPGADLREFTSAGLSLRAFSPWPRDNLRVWLALGLGYAATEAPAYAAPATQASADVSSTKGGYFELPLGIGSSLRLSQSFDLVGEAGARVGFGFTGSMYSPMSPGNDVVAVFVVLGVALQL
jgi:hypothetical protein